MNEFERTVRSILSEHAGTISGSDDVPAKTVRRGRIRRMTIALTATMSVLAAGVGAYSVAIALRNDRAPDVRVVNPPPPSDEASATPSQSASPTSSAAFTDPIRRTLQGQSIGDLIRAHGSMWATDIETQAGASSSLLYRLSDEGTPTTTIHLARYLSGAYVARSPVADDGGIWLLVRAKETDRTAAAGRCAALYRTGEDRIGGEVLLRLDARTNCPTHLIEVGPTQEESDSEEWDGTTPTVHAMAYTTGAVWLSTRHGLRRIDPSTRSVTRIDGTVYQSFAAGFGSLWVGLPSNDRNESVRRLDPRDGRVIARIDSDLSVISFGFGAGSVWAATLSTNRPQSGAIPNDPNGALMQIDPTSNRIVREFRNIGGPDSGTDLTIDDGNVYACHLIAVVRLAAGGVSRRHQITLRYGDRPRQITTCRAYDGVLWVGILEYGLYRVDTARVRWVAD